MLRPLARALLAITIPYNVSAFAGGMLDFADPCVKAQGQFASTSDALRARADAVIKEWDGLKGPPDSVKGFYTDAVKLGLYNAWLSNPQTAPLIQVLTQADPKFDSKKFFLEKVYPAAVTPTDEAKLVEIVFKSDYATSIRPKFAEDRITLEQKINEQKGELDKSCKKDVFNQVFRATIGNAMLIVASNKEAAQHESGDLAKALRITSGISLTDIQQYGIRGGPNSEFNKALNSLGNSDVKNVLTSLINYMDPSKWAPASLPSLHIPDINIAPGLPNVHVGPTITVGNIPVPVLVVPLPVPPPPPIVQQILHPHIDLPHF